MIGVSYASEKEEEREMGKRKEKHRYITPRTDVPLDHQALATREISSVIG